MKLENDFTKITESAKTKLNNLQNHVQNEENSNFFWNKKKLGIAAVVLVFCILTLFKIFNNSNAGYYDGNKWGTSYEAIEKKYKDEHIEYSSGGFSMYRMNFLEIEDTYDWVSFSFDENDKLESVTVLFINNNTTVSTAELQAKIEAEYTKKYGKPNLSFEIYSSWETKKSKIYTVHSTDVDGVLTIYEKK